MKTNCSGLLGWVFGHKFEERSDFKETCSKEISANLKESIKSLGENSTSCGDLASEILETVDGFEGIPSGDETYVMDVCVRCGDVVKRQ